MKKEELRIGNTFIEKYSGAIIHVTGLTDTGIYFTGSFEGKWQAEPILLTEEWLLKLGFIKEIIADDVWYIHEQGDMMICGDRMYLSNNEFSVKEMPVHRLQNLYYFFHNEELEIKP